jgi:Carboxypeptidase regulatory-like domain/PKD-like domain
MSMFLVLLFFFPSCALIQAGDNIWNPSPTPSPTASPTFSPTPTAGPATSPSPHKCLECKNLDGKVNQFADVIDVTLSTEIITLPCPPAGPKSRSGTCNDNRTVGVVAHASDPENDVLIYSYTVSGGRIIGTGANVQWDMSTAQPGTFTITVGVDDGCGLCGKTITKTIKVQECPNCTPLCSCSPLSVDGPSGLTSAGDTMTFVASVSGSDVTFNWTVSAGTIESGQGTSSITVRTTQDMADSNITATVEISGIDPGCGCITQASETAVISRIPQYIMPINGNIAGKVRLHGRVVTGATVTISYQGDLIYTTYTGPDGRYQFESVRANIPFRITVQKGTHTKTVNVTVPENDTKIANVILP